MIEIGLMVAIASALVTSLSFLFKQRGAAASPEITLRHPIKSALGLFASKWWILGWCLALVAWVLHVAALTFAPLSLVQAVYSRTSASMPGVGRDYSLVRRRARRRQNTRGAQGKRLRLH